MRTFKKILGCLLVGSPLVALGVIAYVEGEIKEFLLALIVAAVIFVIVWLGMSLFFSDYD